MRLILLALFLSMTHTIFSQENFKGQPKELVESDGIILPVYDFDGFKPFLESSDDITYVINFWATWCKPCVEEMPHFIQLAKELEGSDIEFVFVSLDFRKYLEGSVIPFVIARGIEKHTVMLNDPDANSWINQVDPSWSGAIPATLIFRGDKREFHEKKLSYEELKTILQSYLNL